MFGWFKKKLKAMVDPPPPLTERMKALGFHWVKIKIRVPDCDGVPDFIETWMEACNTCGGNCGQCGTSLGMGLPVDLEHMVKATGMNNPVNGFRRGK